MRGLCFDYCCILKPNRAGNNEHEVSEEISKQDRDQEEREREGERENSNSKTLILKDSSVEKSPSIKTHRVTDPPFFNLSSTLVRLLVKWSL